MQASRRFVSFLVATALAGIALVAVSSSAQAGWGWDRDAGSKARGEVVAPSRNQYSQQRYNNYNHNAAPSPVIAVPVQPNDVATRSTIDQRRFSYSPTPMAQPQVNASPVPVAAAPGVEPRSYGRFSYDPGAAVSMPSRSTNRSRTPSYMLPKSDPNRYR